MRNYRKLSVQEKLMASLAIEAKAKNTTVSALVNEIVRKYYIKQGRIRGSARKAANNDIFKDIIENKRDN